jgi:hypothetical protein
LLFLINLRVGDRVIVPSDKGKAYQIQVINLMKSQAIVFEVFIDSKKLEKTITYEVMPQNYYLWGGLQEIIGDSNT